MTFSHIKALLPCILAVPFTSAQTFLHDQGLPPSAARTLLAPAGLSASCNATFATNLKCHAKLPAITFHGQAFADDDSAKICDPECRHELEALRQRQEQDCKGDTTVHSSGSARLNVTSIVDELLWTFDFVCRKDNSSGHFCASEFYSWVDGGMTNASCSDCVLGEFQLQMNHPSRPIASHPEWRQNFSSLTSHCSATDYAPTKQAVLPTAHVNVAKASFKRPESCKRPYTIQSGDDCYSISRSQNVSTSALLGINNLEGSCTNFPSHGQQICLPESCEVYTVLRDESCRSVINARGGKITAAELVSWNKDINSGCTNVAQLAGKEICVSEPGVPSKAATGTITGAPPSPTNVCDGFRFDKPASCYLTSYGDLPYWEWPKSTISRG